MCSLGMCTSCPTCSRVLRALVPYLLSYLTYLVPYLLLCPTCFAAGELSCHTCSRALRAFFLCSLVPRALSVLAAAVLFCFTCLVSHVPHCPRAPVSYVPRFSCTSCSMSLFIVFYLCVKSSSIFLWKVTI